MRTVSDPARVLALKKLKGMGILFAAPLLVWNTASFLFGACYVDNTLPCAVTSGGPCTNNSTNTGCMNPQSHSVFILDYCQPVDGPGRTGCLDGAVEDCTLSTQCMWFPLTSTCVDTQFPTGITPGQESMTDPDSGYCI